jgi:hypothetical protein
MLKDVVTLINLFSRTYIYFLSNDPTGKTCFQDNAQKPAFSVRVFTLAF